MVTRRDTGEGTDAQRFSHSSQCFAFLHFKIPLPGQSLYLNMKGIVLTLITLVYSFKAIAQKGVDESLDSLIVKNVYRGIKAPDDIDSDNAGATILRIYISKDSLKVQSLYSSGNGFDFTDDKYLVKWMNKQLAGQIPKDHEVILPLYFEYSDGTKYVPSEEVKAEVKRNIKRLKRHHKVHQAGTITTRLIHVRRILEPAPVIVKENE